VVRRNFCKKTLTSYSRILCEKPKYNKYMISTRSTVVVTVQFSSSVRFINKSATKALWNMLKCYSSRIVNQTVTKMTTQLLNHVYAGQVHFLPFNQHSSQSTEINVCKKSKQNFKAASCFHLPTIRHKCIACCKKQ